MKLLPINQTCHNIYLHQVESSDNSHLITTSNLPFEIVIFFLRSYLNILAVELFSHMQNKLKNYISNWCEMNWYEWDITGGDPDLLPQTPIMTPYAGDKQKHFLMHFCFNIFFRKDLQDHIKMYTFWYSKVRIRFKHHWLLGPHINQPWGGWGWDHFVNGRSPFFVLSNYVCCWRCAVPFWNSWQK